MSCFIANIKGSSRTDGQGYLNPKTQILPLNDTCLKQHSVWVHCTCINTISCDTKSTNSHVN